MRFSMIFNLYREIEYNIISHVLYLYFSSSSFSNFSLNFTLG